MQLLQASQVKYQYSPCKGTKKLGTIVFCHGYAVTSEYFSNVAEVLNENYDYYAIELEGMGITPVKDKKQLSPKYYSEQLAHLIRDDLNLRDIILIGHSMGGGIVGMTSNLIPDRIKLLVMVSPMNSSIHIKLLKSFKLTPQTYDKGWKAAKIIYHHADKLFPGHEQNESLRKEVDRQIRVKPNTKSLFSKMNSISNLTNLKKSEKGISVPTLLMVSEYDNIIDANFAIKRLSKNPNITPVIIKDSGHVPFEDEPEQFLFVLNKALTLINNNQSLKEMNK